jgi:glucose/arabinose dehydrogenase
MFPEQYKNQIFIARPGSWNRTKKLGGDIVVAKLNEDGTVKSIEPFVTGFIEDNKYVGRPADIAVMKDGSLLISDDSTARSIASRMRNSSTVLGAVRARAIA